MKHTGPEKLHDGEQARVSRTLSRHAAMRYIVEAWEEAVYDGLHPDTVATAALFAAISEMVSAYGEEEVAEMAEGLGERIRNGEFTLYTVRQ